MSRIYKAGHSLMRSFTVTDDTGAAANADATPIGAALRNGVTDGAVAVTVAAHSTGVYHASFTIPGTYAAGDVVELVVTAAVGGVTTKAVVDSVRLVAFDPTDADALGVGNLDTNVGSRLAYADYTAPDNAGIGALGDAVDALPVPPTPEENADALLGRSLAGGADGGRTVGQALSRLRNRVVYDSTAGTVTIYDTDDATALWVENAITQAVQPIVSTDPTT
jgi:hypothetical protein